MIRHRRMTASDPTRRAANRYSITPRSGRCFNTDTVAVDLGHSSVSITRTRIWRKILEFIRLPLPLLPVGWGRFFYRNIWPDFRVFRIQWQPFLKPWFGISLDGIDGTFRFANATVDAFSRMDHEHILALVEAVHGAHGDAIHGFAANAAFVDDESQFSTPNTLERATLAKKVVPYTQQIRTRIWSVVALNGHAWRSLNMSVAVGRPDMIALLPRLILTRSGQSTQQNSRTAASP